MEGLTGISGELRKLLLLKGKTLSSNVGLSILLLILEKIVDVDFTCPCGAECRVLFLVLLFIVPGLVAFVIMTAIQGVKFLFCKYSAKENLRKMLACMFPAAVWVILLFLDGRYYTCIKTDWLGRYVTVNHNVLEKWCEPDNGTLYHERLKKSYGWYSCSQSYGLILLGVLAIFMFMFLIMTKKVASSNSPSGGHENVLPAGSSDSGGHENVLPAGSSDSGGHGNTTNTTSV